MQTANRTSRRVARAAAFTLTELLIAVGVLVVVIVAAAQIFSSASRVTSVAEANADLLQTAAAIESQIRQDIANVPANSFLVIQQVEVNPNGTAQTLDPPLGNVEIRADQLAFFTRGFRATTQFIGTQESSGIPNPAEPNNAALKILTSWPQESAIARVYYGHAITAPNLPTNFGPVTYQNSNAPVVPWIAGNVETENWLTGALGAGRVPNARPSQWPLARMATLMAADGTTSYAYALNSASNGSGVAKNASMRLFTSRQTKLAPLDAAASPLATGDPLWTSGRVDICKWQMDDLFSQTAYQYDASNVPVSNDPLTGGGIPFIRTQQPWGGPSVRLRMLQTLGAWALPATRQNFQNGASQLYVSYPRVEKSTLSIEKSDFMLTAPVLAANCSSFKVEWTWAEGVGRNSLSGTLQPGLVMKAGKSQPWFGLDDSSAPGSVAPVSNQPSFLTGVALENNPSAWGGIGLPLVIDDPTNPAATVVCNAEGVINRTGDATLNGKPIWRTPADQGAKRVYQAVFGLNQSDPTALNPLTTLRGPYTPLPSALRITIRLHDPLGRIEGGREFQFIVDLPRK
jgi:type II secretory pathway pseudopilin PulG